MAIILAVLHSAVTYLSSTTIFYPKYQDLQAGKYIVFVFLVPLTMDNQNFTCEKVMIFRMYLIIIYFIKFYTEFCYIKNNEEIAENLMSSCFNIHFAL